MKREYPERPIVGVGGIVFKGDDVLLIRRGKEPRKGEWSLPGGAQEIGETAEQALLRELVEETGVKAAVGGFVEVVDLIAEDGDGRVQRHYTLLDYWGEWISGDLAAGGDADDAAWVAEADLADYALWDKTLEVIETARRMRSEFREGPEPAAATEAAQRKIKLPVFEVEERPHTVKGHLKAFGFAAVFGFAAWVVMMAIIFLTKWIGMAG